LVVVEGLPTKAKIILTENQQIALRVLLSKGRLNPHQLQKYGTSYEGARKILKRLADLSIAKRLSRGGYEPTTHGVYVYLSTMLKTPQELVTIAERYGSLLPYSLGKTNHFKTTGVLDLALGAWRRINPLDYALPSITAGDMFIQQASLDDVETRIEDIIFHIKAQHNAQLLGRESLQTWVKSIERDSGLKQFRDEINMQLRTMLLITRDQLGIPPITGEDLEFPLREATDLLKASGVEFDIVNSIRIPKRSLRKLVTVTR